jgi:hypothetical protein
MNREVERSITKRAKVPLFDFLDTSCWVERLRIDFQACLGHRGEISRSKPFSRGVEITSHNHGFAVDAKRCEDVGVTQSQ